MEVDCQNFYGASMLKFDNAVFNVGQRNIEVAKQN